MAKLQALERRLERKLSELLSKYLGLSPEECEELVPMRGNRVLKGGAAWAVIARKDPEAYAGSVMAKLPCTGCQESGGTFRLCHLPRVGIDGIDDIPPDEVPEEFHRDVGQDPVEVMSWEW